MKSLLSVTLLCVIGFASADVASEFWAAKIIPEILDNAPTDFIEVKYGDVIANLGNELNPAQATFLPEVNFNYTEGASYTLVMLDSDSPIPKGTQIKHWIVCNIRDGSVSNGETITEYMGPMPPEGTGLHHYIFLLFEQNQAVIDFDKSDSEVRLSFFMRDCAGKNDLGNLVAGNFFVAQYQGDVKK